MFHVVLVFIFYFIIIKAIFKQINKDCDFSFPLLTFKLFVCFTFQSVLLSYCVHISRDKNLLLFQLNIIKTNLSLDIFLCSSSEEMNCIACSLSISWAFNWLFRGNCVFERQLRRFIDNSLIFFGDSTMWVSRKVVWQEKLYIKGHNDEESKRINSRL